MDTSKTYIKMCEKAEEIQELKRCPRSTIPHRDETKVMPGDVFYCKGSMSGDYYVGPDFSEGDIFVSGEVSCVHMDYPDAHIRKDESRYSYDDAPLIWLPRQDQLQEMVINNPFKGLLNMHFFFADFFYDETMEEVGCGSQPIEPQKFTSMEQLWLAFVMKEKYNKAWNGKEWE